MFWFLFLLFLGSLGFFYVVCVLFLFAFGLFCFFMEGLGDR